jgi:hypothetical protein
MTRGRTVASWLFAVTMLVGAAAWAQDYGPGGPSEEGAPGGSGPQPDVARVSLVHGDVSMQRGDSGDWESTTVNAPLVRGDQVATGEKSRAEVQLDYADILRLAAKSQAKIAELTRTRIQLQVAQGYANFTQFKGSEAEVEIDTPNVAVRPLKQGRYRVQVNSDSETDVIVREGMAEITTPQGSTTVKAGEMIMVRGTDNPEYKIAGAPGKDDWDRWNKDRDNTIKDAQSWGHTNRYYTGVNDLDAYGHWIFVPGYGWVWQPYYTSATWAPYQAGRWVWEPFYGWTWVSYEPWGWTPYHYGRWFFYAGNWCWWPGPVFVGYRPVWSPAFVFFVGFGHHSSFGFGSIGWFPVGPHDPFYPWWGRGFNRVNVVNITNITVINGRHGEFIPPLAVRGRQPFFSNVSLVETNPRVRAAVTSVGVEDFGHGNFSNRRFGVDGHEWHDARVMTANLPVVPSRENLRVAANGSAGLGATVQPRTVDRFYTRHEPPAAESFHTQVERVQRAVGPEAVNARNAERGHIEVSRTGPVNTGAAAGAQTHDEAGGRFGRVESGNASAAGSEGEKESAGSFRRFGNSGPSNGGPASRPAAAESTTAAGGNERIAQSNAPATPGNGGNSAQGKSQNDRTGWHSFGSRRPASDQGGNAPHSDQTTASPIRNDQGRAPRTDNSPAQGHGAENQNWEKFPSAGQGEGRGAQPSGSPSPAQTPRNTNEDRGGWQHFPSNGGSRNDGSTNSKPPLELHRPIVTPRNDSQPGGIDTRSSSAQPPYSPTPQREEPRYTPTPQRSQPRYSPPSSSRSESPRYSPPSRSESHRSRSSGSSSSHSGSSRSGSGHSDSKSSSGPKH